MSNKEYNRVDFTPEETAENIVACWDNSDRTYESLKVLIVRAIKQHLRESNAVNDLEIETLENKVKWHNDMAEGVNRKANEFKKEVEYYKDLKFKEQTEFKAELDKLKQENKELTDILNNPEALADYIGGM